MSSSLITGGRLVGRAGPGGEPEVIRDGALYQEDGIILAVGPRAELASRYQPDEVIGGDGMVVLPGFINAHHHLGLTPFQMGIPDLPLEMWIGARLAMRAVDPYLDTLYSAFEMIASGITTVQHLHGHMFLPPDRWTDTFEAVLRAYRDVGMRVSFSSGIVEQDRLVLAEEDFLATLSAELRDRVRALPGSDRVPVVDQLQAAYGDLVHRWGGGSEPRVSIQLAPQNLHWCSDAALRAIKEASDRDGAAMHMHLVESPYQKEYARRRTGGTAVAHLAELGLLGPSMTLGHAVWLTEDDIEQVAASGTFICHNASSNLRLRSGIAPLNQFLERGVKVAIGIDEAGINEDRDMLQELRMVLNLHRVPGVESPAPDPRAVFQMATEHGALTTGFGATIGVLEPGRSADLSLLDWDSVAAPHLAPEVGVVDAILHRARSAAVRTVLVAGEPIYRDGRFTRVDQEAALAELSASLRGPRSELEMDRGRLADELVPRIKSFLSGWSWEGSDPFYRVNAKS